MSIKLAEINEELSEDILAVSDWADEIYSDKFSKYFKDQRELYVRLESKERLITDSELEQILTTLPLELFSVSEVLSQFKISQEVVKLRVKQIEADKVSESDEKSVTKKKEDAAMQTLEHKLLITVYSAVISRVESEISFSRELIMSAKKIWDARKSTESSNPVGPVVTDGDELPEYSYKSKSSLDGKTYIK